MLEIGDAPIAIQKSARAVEEALVRNAELAQGQTLPRREAGGLKEPPQSDVTELQVICAAQP